MRKLAAALVAILGIASTELVLAADTYQAGHISTVPSQGAWST